MPMAHLFLQTEYVINTIISVFQKQRSSSKKKDFEINNKSQRLCLFKETIFD